jgi:hypothetical protein
VQTLCIVQISEAQFHRLIRSLDLNGSGTIEFDEFCFMVSGVGWMAQDMNRVRYVWICTRHFLRHCDTHLAFDVFNIAVCESFEVFIGSGNVVQSSVSAYIFSIC